MKRLTIACPLLLLIILLVSPAAADPPSPAPPAPEVILPDAPLPPAPPAPSPKVPIKLPKGQVYLIRARVPCDIVDGTEGLVSIKAIVGPTTVYAHFTDSSAASLVQMDEYDLDGPATVIPSPDGVEKRQLVDKFVWIVRPIATGKTDLIVTPQGGKRIRRCLDVSVGPPDPPNPPNPPNPPTPPAPIPVAGFRVLIIEDGTKRTQLPEAQQNVLLGKPIRDYLNAKCVAGAGGTKEWRIWDQTTDASADGELWVNAMKRKRDALPWIIISDGKTGYEGPLPGNIEDTLTLLRKYGGN